MFPKYFLFIVSNDYNDEQSPQILEFDDLDDCYEYYDEYSSQEYDCAVFRRMAHSYKSL